MGPIFLISTNGTSYTSFPDFRGNHIEASVNRTTPHTSAINPPPIDTLRKIILLSVPILYAMVAIATLISSILIYGDFITRRSKSELCQVLLRMMDAPPGPARDEVILDTCVDIEEWFYTHNPNLNSTKGMTQKMMRRVPGAERHWERKNPGWTRYVRASGWHAGTPVRWDLERDAERHKLTERLGRDEKSPSLCFTVEAPGGIPDYVCSKTRRRFFIRQTLREALKLALEDPSSHKD
ncbi:hypothetical protein VTL71DRAFT_13254 [Oculimacula yallundae]|uniref:Uncharacterized protein n=1 Tax=Oculimacula yallundae TaxID=86028 RepID=A0ABR4CJZ9_9HELO